MSTEERKRRDRVAKACASCRRKKIKCDGSKPCAHCRHANFDCIYQSNKQRKPRTAAKPDAYGSRIDKLENLILKLASKVGGVAGQSPDIRLSSVLADNVELNGAPFDGLQESLDQEDLITSLPLPKSATSLSVSDPPLKKDSFFQQCKLVLNDSMEDTVNNLLDNKGNMLHYKGTHVGVDMMFSEESIKWIRSKLRQEDQYITYPLETLSFYMSGWKKLFLSVWAEPEIRTAEEVAVLKRGIFPEDSKVVCEMLALFDQVHMANFICEGTFITELFDAHYSKETDPAKRRKLSYSELMVMSLVMALCLSVIVDKRNLSCYVPDPKNLHLDRLSVEELVALQEEVFMNSVFYFHRVSVISEGVTTIQALLLVVVYLETSWVTSDVNFAFTSTAVRYAQELGLHRFETFEHLPDKERLFRTRLWAACQYLDVEISYRMGKPPLVNIVDVSTLTPLDPNTIPDTLSRNELLTVIAQECRPGVVAQPHERAHMYNNFYLYKLSQIRSFTYHRLFSASVRYDSLKRIQEIVTGLNNSMFDLANSIDEKFRPRFFYEPEFEQCLQFFAEDFTFASGAESLIVLHLTYFHHISVINRIPWQVVTAETDSPPLENAEFRKLSLDSARTILHIVRAVNRNCAPFFTINWLIVFPFVATMNLLSNCLNHSDDPECFKDLSLLIDVSMNFFGHYSPLASQQTTRLYYLRLHMADLLVRILMRIALKVVEERSNMNILSSNPGLRAHLECVEDKYPQFYIKGGPSSQMMKYFCDNKNRDAFCLATFLQGVKKDKPPRMSGSSSTVDTEGSLPGYNYFSGTHAQETPFYADPKNFGPSNPLDFGDVNGDPKSNPEWLADDNLSTALGEDFYNLPNFFFDNGL